MTGVMPTRRRALHTGVLLAAALLGAACATPTLGPDSDTADTWHYRGEQRLPAVLQLEGALAITREDATRFEGTIDLRRTDAAGRVERLAGLVRGRRSATAIEFEVALDGGVMRHVGRLEGARHVGTWLDDGAVGGALVSGSFELERTP